MQIYGNSIKCDPDDIGWITETVGKIPHKQLMIGVINKYSSVYSSAEGGTLRQQGAARRQANTRLRVYVKSLLESMR